MLSTLKRKTEIINELDNQILSSIEEGNIGSEMAETSAFMDEVELCLIAIEECLNPEHAQAQNLNDSLAA